MHTGLSYDGYQAVAQWNDGWGENLEKNREANLSHLRFLYDKYLRWQALDAFRKQPACMQLAEANKRVNNILNKSDKASSHADTVNTALFQQQEETRLYEILLEVEKDISEKSAQKAYTEALLSLLPLCEPIAAFFDKVMVNVEDKTLRDNRLTLLHMLKKTLQHVADLSQLQVVNV
jgi:glycyl-tRNA synthetase beta chain